MSLIKSPFGKADVVALTAAATQAVTISNAYTIIDGVTTPANGSNRTINLTISSELTLATIFLKSKTVATETTIPGTGMTGPTITGVAGKTFCTEYVYDGLTFKAVAAPVQID